jgi:hypothetical protein
MEEEFFAFDSAELHGYVGSGGGTAVGANRRGLSTTVFANEGSRAKGIAARSFLAPFCSFLFFSAGGGPCNSL